MKGWPFIFTHLKDAAENGFRKKSDNMPELAGSIVTVQEKMPLVK